MALDPSIVFRGTIPQIPDVGARLARGAQAQGIFQNMRNEAAMAPVRQQIAETEAALNNIKLAEAEAQRVEDTKQRDTINIARNYLINERNIKAGNYGEVVKNLESYVDRERAAGQTDDELSDTLNAIEVFKSNDSNAITSLINTVKGAVDYAKGRGWIGVKGKAPAKVQEIEALIEMSKSDDPEISEPAKVALGTKAKAGESAAERIARTGQAGVIAESQAIIEGEKAAAKETGKLSAQLKLQPEVKQAVTFAAAQAKSDVDAMGERKSNRQALQVYDAAMAGLTEALGGTTTGPAAGWLPALTTNQQIADGAVAAMAPVLKQLFRGAGEGSFSDSDQKLLMDMVPTRKDTAEARLSKIQNIDAIVRAKLAIVDGDQSAPVETPQSRLDELRRKAGL